MCIRDREKRRGRREDGGQPRGSSGSPFKSASGPKVGHRGPHGVPPPEASSTRAVPWHPRTPTWPPRRALATSRGSGPETPPTPPQSRPAPRNALPHAQRRHPRHPAGSRTRAGPFLLLTRGPRALRLGTTTPRKTRSYGPGRGRHPNKRRGRFRSRESGSRTQTRLQAIRSRQRQRECVGGAGEEEAQRARAGSAWGENRFGEGRANEDASRATR